MEMVNDQTNQLQKHFSTTYRALRQGMFWLAVGLPIALWLGGLFAGVCPKESSICLQPSISNYYHAGDGLFLRDVFVGALFAVGVCLILYKGFSQQENWVLNLAGVLAFGIALFPTGSDAVGRIHGLCALAFFACIAWVCVVRASDTLSLVNDRRKEQTYRNTYRVLGALMVLSPAVAFVLTVTVQPGAYIFFAELVGIYTFAAYWWVKGSELRQTDADLLALKAKLQRKLDKIVAENGGSSTPGDTERQETLAQAT